MTKTAEQIGQSYLVAEAALAGIAEQVAQDVGASIAGINLTGYRRALNISHRLTELETERLELMATIGELDAATQSGISHVPNPIQSLVARLNDLTERITLGKAQSQLR